MTNRTGWTGTIIIIPHRLATTGLEGTGKDMMGPWRWDQRFASFVYLVDDYMSMFLSAVSGVTRYGRRKLKRVLTLPNLGDSILELCSLSAANYTIAVFGVTVMRD